MILLATGELIDPTAIEMIAYAPWEKSNGSTREHRAVVFFKSGNIQEWPVGTAAEAIALRDRLVSQVSASLSTRAI